MKDPDPRMRVQALWVSESLYKAGDKSFEKIYLTMMKDEDTQVKMRAMMTGRLLKIPGTDKVVKQILALDSTQGVQLVGKQVLDPPIVNSFFGRSYPDFNAAETELVNAGAEIYASFCSACHGVLGTGTPFGEGKVMAPSFLGSKHVQAHPDYVTKVLLHGLTGKLGGASYAGGLMAPMGNNSDEWIASIASFIRVNFENESSIVTPNGVARIRQETSKQKTPYTFETLWSSIPKVLVVNPRWKVTASHTGEIRKGSTASPLGAFTFEGWTTGITQQKGMWFQIEFPKSVRLTELQFKSPPISRGWREGSPPPIPTFPRGYDVEVSMNGSDWTKVVSNGAGIGTSTSIRFAPVNAKHVRITLTHSETVVHGERRGQPFDFEVVWNMRELSIYGFEAE